MRLSCLLAVLSAVLSAGAANACCILKCWRGTAAPAPLAVAPAPAVMKDLAFTVEVTPPSAAGAGAGRIALSMPGMYMGENRAALRPDGAGRYAGRAVVLRCASGRTDWVAEVVARLPGGGEARARFPLQAAD